MMNNYFQIFKISLIEHKWRSKLIKLFKLIILIHFTKIYNKIVIPCG
jgi:hypothetical protein